MRSVVLNENERRSAPRFQELSMEQEEQNGNSTLYEFFLNLNSCSYFNGSTIRLGLNEISYPEQWAGIDMDKSW